MTQHELERFCDEIENAMRVSIEPNIPEQVQEQLSNLIPYLSNLSSMISFATENYDNEKRMVAIKIIGTEKLNLKANILKLFIEGELSKQNALYERVESISKNLRSSVEGLRSLLSYEKENIRENKFVNQNQH